MKTKHILVVAPLALALFAGAASAEAQLLDVNLNVGVDTPAVNGDTSVELDTYVQTMASTNAEVTDVDTTSGSKVIVEYKRPAKLFGFINVNLTEKAVVKANGEGKLKADVSKSWWSIFASTDAKTNEFSDTLKARVENSVSASASQELTASEKAEFIAEINAAAQATYSVDSVAN